MNLLEIINIKNSFQILILKAKEKAKSKAQLQNLEVKNKSKNVYVKCTIRGVLVRSICEKSKKYQTSTAQVNDT